MGELFAALQERGGVAAEVADGSWLRAMLEAQAALARALVDVGRLEAEHGEAIIAAARAESFDPAEVGRSAESPGNPAAPLVKALRAQVAGFAADQVHRGATSQDIVDTAAMLIARRACAVILGDLRGAADAAAGCAAAHRDTAMAGRTLLQHAVPTTFGLKAAGWMTALDTAAGGLSAQPFAAQLGGAAGTLAALDDDGPAVVAAYAAHLGLTAPTLPWHTDRTRIGALAGALGVAAGAAAKVALDIVLLAQTEVGEVVEAWGGGSSTMPHKRNPVPAVAARACAAQAPALVATLLTAMAHEHERGAGPWHAEWRALSELLVACGSAASWLRTALETLEVDGERMRSNLDSSGGRMLAERVAAELAPILGRDSASEAVQEAAADGGGSFADALARHPVLRDHLDRTRIDALLDPSTYLGSAGALVDRALAARAGGPA